MTDVSALIGLLVAALGGAGIGVERQWSGHASGTFARFAGIRTFTLIGYIARRVVGPAHGYPLTGALAGVVSSTNATFTFARLSRMQQQPSAALATGAVAACTMLFPRVLIATSVLDDRVARALVPYLAAPFAIGLAVVALWLRIDDDSGPDEGEAANPLQVWPALQMAATFQVVLFAVALMRGWFGEGGLLATGAVLGLTDVDALTLSMTRSVATDVSAQTAARAIAIGIVANSVMKAGIAGVLGDRSFAARTGGVLAAMAAALVAPLVLLR